MEDDLMEMVSLYQKAVQCYQQQEPEKQEEGFQLLLEAAENGVTPACKMLGLLYMSGQYAPYPEIDETMAVRWWRAAAENGDEEAMFWLGQCYEDGIGVDVNPEEAAIWKKFAVANGFVAEGDEGESLPAESEEQAPITSKDEKHKDRKKDKAKKDKKHKSAKVKTETSKTETKVFSVSRTQKEGEPEKEIKKANETQQEVVLQPRKRFVRPVETGKAVIQKKQFQLKEVDKKQEEEEAEVLRFAREEEKARKISNQYRMRVGTGGALCCLLMLWVFLLFFYWIVRRPLQEHMFIFWILAAVFSGAAVLSGYSLGVKKAQRRIELVAEYRKTPFYHAHGCELGQMSRQQQWCYKIYRSLSKNYFPVTYRKKIDLPELRGYRGCLYTNWIYQSDKEKAQPEFVILTEKAVYVVRTVYLTGTIRGDLADTGWSLFSDGAKDLTAERIPNLVDENARSIRIMKEDLVQYFDLPLEQIPFYNVIFWNQEVDIKGLRRIAAEDDVVFVQGFADKLRGSLGVWESKIPTHNMGLDELTFAFEQIGRQFIKRSGW